MSVYSPSNDAPRSYTLVWVITLLLIVGFVIGLLMFPPLYDSPKEDASSSVLFVGRFHPILLHMPVGALGLLCLMELLCFTRRGEESFGAGALLTLLVGSAGSVMAVMAGIMLSREGGYQGGNFTLHQTLALVGTAGVLLALVIRIYAMGQGSRELMHAYRAVFFGSFGLMGLGAHFGGNMSHGSKFLTEHAPEPMKSQMIGMEKWMLSFVEKPKAKEPAPAPEAPTPAPAPVQPTPAPVAVAPSPTPTPTPTPPAPAPASDEKLVFQHVILPIFEAKCNKCHGEEKQKGELRLDTFEFTMQGGENGDNIVAGKPADSLTMQRIDLPEDDDEHMPPEGKDQLTPAETAAIRYWIQAGASATQKVSEAQFPPEAKEAVKL
jgi:uncharacterized membrane protein/mono/diheme cytochrome c family protein